MMTQSDLFSPADEITGEVVAECEAVVADATPAPIAIPCGFRDRHNGPCRRLGNWPVMMDGKQMACRNRPMVHCDPACFKGDPPAPDHGIAGDDVIWGEEEAEYGDAR